MFANSKNLSSTRFFSALVYIFFFAGVALIPFESQAQESPLHGAFLELTELERKYIQTVLQSHGVYNEPVDGLWGQKTETALLLTFETHPNIEFGDYDLSTGEGATAFLDTFAATSSVEGDECDGCGELDGTATNEIGVASPNVIAELEGRCYGYASLSGLCWNLTALEMVSIVSSRGFNCEVPIDTSGADFLSVFGARIAVPNFVCVRNNDSAQILIFSDQVAFTCVNFNACNYSTQELGQMIIDEGILSEMENLSWITDAGVRIWKFCGRTFDGQIICVSEEATYTLQSVRLVYLGRGTIGQGGVSFN